MYCKEEQRQNSQSGELSKVVKRSGLNAANLIIIQRPATRHIKSDYIQFIYEVPNNFSMVKLKAMSDERQSRPTFVGVIELPDKIGRQNR